MRLLPHQPAGDSALLRRLPALPSFSRGLSARGILFRFLQSFCLELALAAVIAVVMHLVRGGVASDLALWPLAAAMAVSLLGQMASAIWRRGTAGQPPS